MNLDPRKLKILEVLVNTYIATGEPVSSKSICDLLDFSISSATVRNELSELTELGLLDQPHTSAGRIPSHLGYRTYINKIVNKQREFTKNDSIVEPLFSASVNGLNDLVHDALEILADSTRCAAMSVVPIKGRAEIKNIQLVSTGKYTVIVIMVTSLGIIKNKLVRCEYEFSLKVLSVFQNILQKSFQGREISQVDSKYAEKIINSLDENVALFILPFVKAVVYLAKESASADVTLVGQSNLFFFPELDTKSMRQTVDFLNSTNDILDFLMQYQNEDIRVLIGEESGLHGLYNMSFIISKCKLPPSEEGMIALIGPTRMDYARIIPIVRYLSDTITEIINQILGL